MKKRIIIGLSAALLSVGAVGITNEEFSTTNCIGCQKS